MKKALILGGGDDQRSLVLGLKKRGYSVILIDYYENPRAKELADKHYQVSTMDVERVVEIANLEKVDLVTTACIDQALLSAAIVNERLGLPSSLSSEKALLVTNKLYMKRVLTEHGLPTARFAELEDGSERIAVDVDFGFPLVVKAVDSNGSYGVQLVREVGDLPGAVDRTRRLSRSGRVIAEKYIEGRELSIDALVVGDIAHLLMVTETRKMSSCEGNFTIIQSRYPAKLPEQTLTSLREAVQNISSVFGLDNTPLLVQVIMREEELYIIEFGVRIAGGSKHHLIRFVTGYDIMETYIDSLFGRVAPPYLKPTTDAVALNYIYAFPGVFCGIGGAEKLMERGEMEQLFQYKTVGMRVADSRASRDRVGAFLVSSKNEADLEAKVETCDRQLKVIDGSGVDIMRHGIY